LQLSGDASAVVAAGRLTVPSRERASSADPDSEVQEHLPCVGVTRDGVAMLAYLVGPVADGGYELWTVPVAVEEESEGRAARDVLRVDASAARCLCTSTVLAPPAFSPDARWLYAAIRSAGSGEVVMARFPVTLEDAHGTLTVRAPETPESGRSVCVPGPSPGA
jgi:hypothetical protein